MSGCMRGEDGSSTGMSVSLPNRTPWFWNGLFFTLPFFSLSSSPRVQSINHYSNVWMHKGWRWIFDWGERVAPKPYLLILGWTFFYSSLFLSLSLPHPGFSQSTITVTSGCTRGEDGSSTGLSVSLPNHTSWFWSGLFFYSSLYLSLFLRWGSVSQPLQ